MPLPAPGGGTPSSSAPGYQNESVIAAWLNHFFSSLGFAGANLRAADAAFLGNFQVESSGNPAAYNPAEGAHGIAQWEGGRYWAGLAPYAQQHGLSPSSLSADLGYLGTELSGSYSGVVANLRGVTDPQQAAQIVQSQFEGSTTASLPQRQADATAAYAWLGGATLPGAGTSSADPSQAPALPYKLGSLTGNLTGAQRTGIINYLEAVGNTPAAIGYWLRDNVAGAFGHTGSLGTGKLGAALNAGNLGVYESSGAAGDVYDQALEQAYNAIGAGGGVGYGAGHLSYSWHLPGSGLVGEIEKAAEDVLGWVAKPLVKWLLAALLVVVGLVFVYVAVKMLGDTDSATPAIGQPSSSTSKDDEEAETPKDEGAGVDAEGGEIAAAAA